MHPNPAFRGTPRNRNLAFARARGFGILSVSADGGPLLSHIPFLLDDGGETADLHLVRSNPIARLPSGPAVIAVSGPDGYISPDWYGLDDQAPTWNYIAVHLRGRLERLPDTALEDMLARQSAHFENALHPKPPWTMDKMTPEVRDRMMRMILPFRLRIESVDGTWKLGQNKPDAARIAAADALDGHGQADIARHMRALKAE
ncbi:FMN-binding negative transcriptional regulator [Ovoidimarina sediminis]|uniref:FMN-binding negative transcriptional regulator n=1 Tax=Ovoidimarina sediminis TaxID=3079856 RepID=UPI00290ED298|nr:FMN-binding negative transcriptional regulator [Rhodophyticola sp. MJ-SS7]MDU8942330.1 FMN-binding negative transcriptional regulator [Rhodophyticola sp. MJ-SS7]